MSFDKEYLRKQAGINTPINESNKVRTLSFEADILRSFSSFLNDMKNIKERIDRPLGYGPGPYGSVNQKREEPDMAKLRSIALEKMSLVKETIEEIFGKEEPEDEGEE